MEAVGTKSSINDSSSLFPTPGTSKDLPSMTLSQIHDAINEPRTGSANATIVSTSSDESVPTTLANLNLDIANHLDIASHYDALSEGAFSDVVESAGGAVESLTSSGALPIGLGLTLAGNLNSNIISNQLNSQLSQLSLANSKVADPASRFVGNNQLASAERNLSSQMNLMHSFDILGPLNTAFSPNSITPPDVNNVGSISDVN